MGDVLVKRREDLEKAREKAERKQERRMEARHHGDTEMTPLNYTSNPSYVTAENDLHDDNYTHFAAKLFGVGSVAEDKHKEAPKKRHQFPNNERLSIAEYEDSVDDCLWTGLPDSIIALKLCIACCLYFLY
jgi:hypothetical protein